MGFTEKDFLMFQKNELKPEETFQFECTMCGSCCRKRKEPILITGADIFRIARSFGVSIKEIIEKNTEGYIGESSHVPVMVLRERMDGSCSFLRKGHCMIHQNKPTVCALYPLGRYFDARDMSFHYFLNPNTCQAKTGEGKTWTLREWLDVFKIEETEQMTAVWNKLLTGIVQVTCKMPKEKIQGRVLSVLLYVLYLGYDTNKSYAEQVENNMELATKIFKDEFHKNIRFDGV